MLLAFTVEKRSFENISKLKIKDQNQKASKRNVHFLKAHFFSANIMMFLKYNMMYKGWN